MFSPDDVTVAWLAAPGTIQPVVEGDVWQCASCGDPVPAAEAWLVSYRTRQEESTTRRDLICPPCAALLTGPATRPP